MKPGSKRQSMLPWALKSRGLNRPRRIDCRIRAKRQKNGIERDRVGSYTTNLLIGGILIGSGPRRPVWRTPFPRLRFGLVVSVISLADASGW